ncbi:hypothetical protein J1N35_043175 [Gossypium stocksii]|uniref:Reverse transcriptase zinc-binding domain-containing protein n=1 Tax=Gossypium stocksii TaxID=47602 RepID=A0A9D3U6V2_9ROSI|nr:hypothetical protein J1N35_043175 [Gossypium stocksii]
MSKFWWQKGKGRKGIHWCSWSDLCYLKEDGGLGFRDLAKFNIALLAKQGNLPSLTWRSVWSVRGLLEKGVYCRVGRGDQISVWDDLWILGNEADRLRDHVHNGNIQLVSDLIEDSNRAWKSTVIFCIFKADVARKILQIPLAEIVHEDFKVWRGELLSEFTVRSAYKLLHESSFDPNSINLQTESKKFYQKLWNSNIPSKVKILVWRISWNILPSLANLKLKRVLDDVRCPRCHQSEENSFHIFRSCPITVEA